ncbi:MAG: response regulator transcription factor, partial [Anaerolineae bacterium]|nr:response regulator transcription factor [Anaerolineae bacterium]
RTVELLSALHYAPDHFIRHNMALQVEQELHDARALLSLEDYNSTLEAGRRWTPRQLGYVLLDELGALLASTAPASRQSKAALPDALSEREIEVLRLVAQGLSNSEIAERLVVTTGTVKKHLNNIYGKLGVERRTQALLRAHELGLIDEQST